VLGSALCSFLRNRKPTERQIVDFADAVAIAARADRASRHPSGRFCDLAHGVDVALALGPDATPTAMNAAVLHDILENTDWTIDDLARSGVDPVVCEAVDVLTRRSGETYGDYIRRICDAPGVAGEMARQVKVADLTVSVDREVSDTLRQRYEQSLTLVQSALATAVA
jgi:(p)ppGpp synthase/HD superfamily hydrolase